MVKPRQRTNKVRVNVPFSSEAKREWRGLLTRDGNGWRGDLHDGLQWTLALTGHDGGDGLGLLLSASVQREGWDAPPWFDDGLRMTLVDAPRVMRCRLAPVAGGHGELRPAGAEQGRVAFRVVSVTADTLALVGFG